MILQCLSLGGRVDLVGWPRTCLTLMLLFSATVGCRTPWQAMRSEPNFDRLIEIEQNAEGRSYGREPIASRLRPGGSPPAAGGTEDAIAMAKAQFASKTTEVDGGDLLEGVPAAERELLRREMNAQSTRYSAPAPQPSGEKMAQARRSISDQNSDHDEPAIFNMSDADESGSTAKYQLAAEAFNRQDRSAVKPKAVEGLDGPRPASFEEPRELAGLAEQNRSAGAVVPASHAEKASDQSLPDVEELDWRQHIYQALAQLEQDSPTNSPEERIHLEMVDRLLQLAVGDVNAAMEPLDGLQPHGQDFVRHSLESLYEVTNPEGNPVESKRYTLAMLSQRKALTHLGAVSNLEVRNATFCTEVDGFGVVTKFPQYNFKQDQELLLYCELDNFVSSFKENKGYETQLQGSYEIVDGNGRRVADQLLPMDSHICRNQRRDYFIAYRIYMPQNIDAGRYQLKLIVEDLKGRKFGQSTLDFQIVN